MNYAEFTRTLRTITRSNATTFTDQMVVDFVNFQRSMITGKIVDADASAFEMKSYTNIVAGQRAYTLPSDLVNRIMKLEVKLDGINWLLAKEIDFNEIQVPTEDEVLIQEHFNDNPPRYTLFREAINIYTGSPLIAVPQGLRLSFNVESHIWTIADLVRTSDISIDFTLSQVGFPQELHTILLYLVSRLYKTTRDKPIPLIEEEQNIDILLAQAIGSYHNENRDRILCGKLPPDYGYNY